MRKLVKQETVQIHEGDVEAHKDAMQKPKDILNIIATIAHVNNNTTNAPTNMDMVSSNKLVVHLTWWCHHVPHKTYLN